MTGRIDLLDDQSNLMAMDETAYDSESLLQEMLAVHPDLPAGEQGANSSHRRWLLVPRVLGQTETARQKKSSGSPLAYQWDEANFLQSIAERVGLDGANAVRKFSSGPGNASCNSGGAAAGTYGAIEIQFQQMYAEPFAQPDMRAELARRLSQFAGVEIPDEALTRRPSFKINLLANEPAL